MLDLRKEEAEAIGYQSNPYDALFDGYEPGWTSGQVATLFKELRNDLVPILKMIVDSGTRPDQGILRQSFPVEKQKEFNTMVAKDIGFDLERGRLDEAVHPFTIGSLHDTRITTLYHPEDPRPALFATIHEAGHGMYEQGYKEEHQSTPLGQPVSFGIHESQSRMWENMVGRSRPFWEHYFPKLKQTFSGALANAELDQVYAAFNDAHPSLIRVEADEVTYNLHIIVRLEMELGLFDGSISIEEAPQAWNEKMESYLQVQVPDNANGVLQDVHWSHGLFGYFPTYALGNLYAAQFYDSANKDMPGLQDDIRNGNFSPLLDWLRTNIHHHGRRYRANELVKNVTGHPLDSSHFIKHLRDKYKPLYS